MKIIFLNIWGGKMQDALANFIAEHALDTDIFCFQEAFTRVRAGFEEILSEYALVTAQKQAGENWFAQATYVKKGIDIVSSTPILEHAPGTGIGLWTDVRAGNRALSICNVHGQPQPGEKTDTPERILQSREILASHTSDFPAVIGGDFNLLPETKSTGLFAREGYRNLIEEYGITSTRNELTWAKYPSRQYFADYVFISPEIPVKNFTVPYNEVSDHLPLILEIE